MLPQALETAGKLAYPNKETLVALTFNLDHYLVELPLKDAVTAKLNCDKQLTPLVLTAKAGARRFYTSALHTLAKMLLTKVAGNSNTKRR